MKKFLIALTMLLGIGANADAGLITYSGNFTASGLTAGPDPISGSWSFDFETDLITGVFFERFSLPLTSLTLSSPTIGSTLFDTSNSGALLGYSNGAVRSISVGGLVAGPGGLTSVMDDWQVSMGTSGRTFYNQSANGSTSSATTASGTFASSAASVPEPTSMLLFGCGAIGLAFSRRRRCKQV